MKQSNSSSGRAAAAWKQILPLSVGLGCFALFVFVSLLGSDDATTAGILHHDTTDASFSSSSSLYLRSGPPRDFDTPPPPETAPRFLQTTTTTTTIDEPAAEQCTETCCEQYMNACDGGNPLKAAPIVVQYILISFLIVLSALFSGLTLGLMSLDKTGLEIVMEGDDGRNATFARKIYPVRKNGNLLLCTLLLGNTAVNALFSILLADKAGGAIGLLISTFLIVIFGEIIPQAACSRYGLEIGSYTVPVVKVIMVLLYPVAKPLALTLDKVLGEELVTTYSSSEMLKMLEIHVAENALAPDTAKTMTGALTFKTTLVQQVMTPLENTFMLSVEDKLNFETIGEIFKKGYSRIPVYEVSPNNVIGLLFTKDLIFIDPEDETRVADFVDIFGRGLHMVWPDSKLGDVLRELKTGKSHMALVRDVNQEDEDQDPFYEIKGIITLEDIIEEILGDEIVDETDAFVDGTHSQRVDRAENFEWARLRLLDSKIVDEKLSEDETMAVTAHLSKNYASVVSLLSERQLHRLVADTPVSMIDAPVMEFGQKLPDDLLYECGVPTDTCTLILAGKVTVLAGTEEFRSDMSSWSLLGAASLSDSLYKPDFSAYVSSGPCRCLQITRARFAAAVDHSTAERLSGSGIMSRSPSRHGGGDASMHSSNHHNNNNKKLAPGEKPKYHKELSRGQMMANLKMARRNSRGGGGGGGSNSSLGGGMGGLSGSEFGALSSAAPSVEGSLDEEQEANDDDALPSSAPASTTTATNDGNDNANQVGDSDDNNNSK